MTGRSAVRSRRGLLAAAVTLLAMAGLVSAQLDVAISDNVETCESAVYASVRSAYTN
jgi:hypothetical protein